MKKPSTILYTYQLDGSGVIKVGLSIIQEDMEKSTLMVGAMRLPSNHWSKVHDSTLLRLTALQETS
jgi:hypothetical protein